MRQIPKIFLQGLAAILPLALTLYVLWWLGTTTEAVFGALLRKVLPGNTHVPGLGLLLGLGVVFAVGFMLRAWWLQALWSKAEALVERVPLVKTIYGSVRDLMTFFTEGDRKRELDQVVMIRLGDPPVQLLGLVMNDHAQELTGRQEDAGQVAVYLPMSYQIGGFMVLVSRDAIERVDLSVEEALRTIITAGIAKKHAPAAASEA